MLSVCIVFKNDFEIIESVVKNLLDTAKSDDIEILIYNDGSVHGDNTPRPLIMDLPYVKVINSNKSFGVGYSFDRAVEQAKGDTIVLMGSDVFPKEGWVANVHNAIMRNPNTLGCAVCVGLAPDRMNLDDPKNHKYYGADLLFAVGVDDLPPKSKLRERRGGYTDLFKAKWLQNKQSDESYPIPCVLGAMYFTSKSFYQKIHGFDTEINNRYYGHRNWGHLEAYISLKSWLYGGGCMLFTQIEVGHIFNRIPRIEKWSKGSRSAEWAWWNALFILETMILNEELRQRLYNFVHYELNFGVARKMIRDHYDNILRIRERNRQEFKYDYHIFEERFNYSFDF